METWTWHCCSWDGYEFLNFCQTHLELPIWKPCFEIPSLTMQHIPQHRKHSSTFVWHCAVITLGICVVLCLPINLPFVTIVLFRPGKQMLLTLYSSCTVVAFVSPGATVLILSLAVFRLLSLLLSLTISLVFSFLHPLFRSLTLSLAVFFLLSL